MLNRDAIPELVDQFQACILLGMSRSQFSFRIHGLLTPVKAPAWRKRRRKAGEKRPRGRPPGYRLRLYRRDDVIELCMMRSRLMQNSGGKGSYRSWRAALSHPDALEKVRELERQRQVANVNSEQALDPSSLRKKSVREALIDIASRNNGLLVVNDALTILLQAGAVFDRDEGRNAIYAALYSAKDDFYKERPGVYHLIDRALA